MRGDVPEDAAVESVRQPAPREVAGKGVRFREIMRGEVAPGRRRRPRAHYAADRPDRQTCAGSSTHPAAIGGTVHVTGIRPGPQPSTEGSLHLLAVADGGPRRTMDYILPFDDDTGERWWLEGAKHVVRQGRGPWRASTEPDLALTRPQERYAGLAPTWARDPRVP